MMRSICDDTHLKGNVLQAYTDETGVAPPSAVCWWVGSLVATVLQYPGPPLLLLPLFLCKWGCPHWGYVHGLPVSRQCSWHSSIFQCSSPRFPLQPNGWPHPLWYWVGSCVLRSQLCTTCQMVGLWLPHLRGQHYYLAWSWRCLVEVPWPLVKQLNI